MIMCAIEYGAVRRILYRFRLIFGVSRILGLFVADMIGAVVFVLMCVFDDFRNGAFDQRVESGQVERIVQRMIKLLER